MFTSFHSLFLPLANPPITPADSSGVLTVLGAIVVLAVIVVFSMALMMAKRFKRCPSNQVLVIYGKSGRRTRRPRASTAGRNSSCRCCRTVPG